VEKHSKKRRVLPVAIALVAIIAISGVAYAYWTASGSGTGTASTAAGVSDLTASSAALTPMYPGDSPQNIVITVHNPSVQTVYVTSVAVAVTGTSDPGCTAADFTLTGSPVAVGAQIAGGGNLVIVPTAPAVLTIHFFNDPVNNQDACKDVTVNLGITIL
jgi:hypothetical protein